MADTLGIVINDLHIPRHDPKVLGGIVKLAHRLQPNWMVVNGDVADFASASLKFKDTPKDHRATTLTYEIQRCQRFFAGLRVLLPNTKLIYTIGNHEDRLRRYLTQHATALRDLPSLSLGTLFGTDELEITTHDYGVLVPVTPSLYVTHGDLVRTQSGASARAHFEKHGVSLIHGHTHRGGSYYKTRHRSTQGAWENFCCCKFEQPYVTGTPDWQHGFSLVYSSGSRFHVVQVPIVDYRFVLDGIERVLGASDAATVKPLGGFR
jgi:UDP-2,3-diacylglucosamine pyrophosphatase LpxH